MKASKLVSVNSTDSQQPTVLVVDFGAQYSQLIARRVREAGVYSEIVPHTLTSREILERKPAAVILSGGPSSVWAEDAPTIDIAALRGRVPVLGICYGFQLIAQDLGGKVEQTDTREYGATKVFRVDTPSVLLADQPTAQQVWMSHSDRVVDFPRGFVVTAFTEKTPIAAIEDRKNSVYGIQWHPEVLHSEFGQALLENFLYVGAGLEPTWNAEEVAKDLIKQVREQVGDGRVICGLSGGVDSSVTAAIIHEAVGDQLTCVFVDHGLLREGEREQVERDYAGTLGLKMITVDARQQFLDKLAGVSDPETKRKIIGAEFIRVFEEAEAALVAEAAAEGQHIEFLGQGTVYPDVVESGQGAGAANIKSHHNVGGLPEDLNFKLVEPLRTLFKDEVRQIGRTLGLPEQIVARQPFPGPGLGIRIVGEVTEERLAILRAADKITREELTAAGLDQEIWQCPVVLLADVRSVGVQGDARTYGHPIVLRPVQSEDAMTADWARVPHHVLAKISARITSEVPEVNRVVLDVTSKPPATIEWE